MKLEIILGQEEMCEAVQKYVTTSIKPIDGKAPRAKFLHVDSDYFYISVAFEDDHEEHEETRPLTRGPRVVRGD